MSAAELTFIKYGFGAGLSIYVIRELLRVITYLVRQKKDAATKDSEDQYKETSRERIKSTCDAVAALKQKVHDREPIFFAMRGEVENIHEIITEKKDGVPLVYNKGLETAIAELNSSQATLARSIEHLARSINGRG